MWITQIAYPHYQHPYNIRLHNGFQLENVDKYPLLSTSYSHKVDNFLHSVQVCRKNVDEKKTTISGAENEILITICCISENNDF